MKMKTKFAFYALPSLAWWWWSRIFGMLVSRLRKVSLDDEEKHGKEKHSPSRCYPLQCAPLWTLSAISS
uniref:Putative secreted protein n=1 Tax=Anopheles darlingi TaxID=43151 RepID=A0A2M4DCB3_ANODA